MTATSSCPASPSRTSRKEAVDFSEPYFLAHQLILTSSNLQIKSLKDLEGKLIAVVNASAGDVAASNAFGKASTNIRRFDNTPLALEELANGGVDAMIGDVGVLQWYMKQNPDKKFNQCRDPEFQEQYFGIGVRKGNTQVLNDVNAGLKKVIESGAYNEVYRKWVRVRMLRSFRPSRSDRPLISILEAEGSRGSPAAHRLQG